ncbi:MAG: YicC/YloC family endoribonuclease [Ignavibacteriota bacterium]
MTGFARVRRIAEDTEIVISLKSVNHRGLDLHFHLPASLDAIENDIRGVVKAGVARGHVQINLNLARVSGETAGLNRPLLALYVNAFREAADLYQIADRQPDLNAALRIPGMLGTGGEDAEIGEALAKAILATATEAVVTLNAFREREGIVTANEMRQRGRNICELVTRMDEIRAGAVPAFLKRLKEKLADLLHGANVDPQRLAQEAAILADRSDIAEELVRLRTHATQLDEILAGNGEVGKRLDFLLQEMNREANTVLSKTGGLGDLGLTITELALAAKSEIDKIREQSLNLE